MSRRTLFFALTAGLLAGAPLHAQTPAVELDGYFARDALSGASEAQVALLLPPAVCTLAVPDRTEIAGPAERAPATAREDTDVFVDVVAIAPPLPRR